MISDIFKTPILNTKVSNTEAALEVYEEVRKKNESRKISNRGGYQSPLLLREEREKIFTSDIMKGILEEAMSLYGWTKPLNFNIDGAWFNANENGDYNISHRHSKCHFSFVWYLKVPDNKSGQLILEHPDSALIMTGLLDLERSDKNHYNSETMQITPSEGLLVMFPASLKHRVERYEGQETRVSLAFNGSFKQ
jgi:uncharacterized protein (TIGR02466 family)